MRLSRSSLTIAAAVALGFSLGPASPGVAAPPTAPGQGFGNNAATVPLFAGTITHSDGTPAGDVDVLLLGWPGAEALAELRAGDGVDVAPIGRTRTAADGTYALAVDRQLLAAWYAKPVRGNVQVEVSATAPGFFASFDGTVDYHPAQGTVNLVPAEGIGDLAAGSTQRKVQSLDLRLQPAEAAPAGAVSAAAAPGGITSQAITGYSCYQYVSDLGRQKTTVGRLSAQTNLYTGKYTYTSGVTNTLGAGTSGSGAYGSWSASGTRTVTSDASLGFNGVSTTGTASFRTEFRYGKYYGTGCSPSGVFYYKAYPSEWIGSVITETNSTSPSATYCASVTNGNTLTQAKSTATTVTGGVTSSAALGINLNSQAGWSNEAKMSVTLKKNGSVCGVNGYPVTGSPGRLVVK